MEVGFTRALVEARRENLRARHQTIQGSTVEPIKREEICLMEKLELNQSFIWTELDGSKSIVGIC